MDDDDIRSSLADYDSDDDDDAGPQLNSSFGRNFCMEVVDDY